MGSGGSRPQTVVQETRTNMPQWEQDARAETFAFGRDISNRPLQQYNGPVVADFNSDQLAAMQRARDVQGQGAAQIGGARNLTYEVAGRGPMMVQPNFGAERVQAGNFLGAPVEAYINPQTDLIESRGIDALNRQRLQALNAVGSRATGAGAFGGSRHAVMEGVTNAEAARAAGDLSANLRGQAFDRATALIQADQNRALQAGVSNQQAGLTANSQNLAAMQGNQQAYQADNALDLQAASSLGNLASTEAQLTSREIALLDAVGQQRYGQDQARIDADMARFYEARDYDLQRLNTRLGAIAGTTANYGSTSTQTSPVTGQNRFMGALGGAASGAALGSMIMPGVGTAVGAALGGLGGVLSEDKEKKNKKFLGRTNVPGISIFSYRYKDDPPGAAKTVGVMASEVEKVMPEAIMRVGGKRVIRPGFLGMLEPQA